MTSSPDTEREALTPLQRAYFDGWCAGVHRALREDLIHETDSAAYIADRDEAIAEIQDHPTPPASEGRMGEALAAPVGWLKELGDDTIGPDFFRDPLPAGIEGRFRPVYLAPQAVDRDAALLWLASVRDDFRRMADEANRRITGHILDGAESERDAARAEERERCAQVCEQMRDKWVDGSDQWGRPCPARVRVTPRDCAAAIRGLDAAIDAAMGRGEK